MVRYLLYVQIITINTMSFDIISPVLYDASRSVQILAWALMLVWGTCQELAMKKGEKKTGFIC